MSGMKRILYPAAFMLLLVLSYGSPREEQAFAGPVPDPAYTGGNDTFAGIKVMTYNIHRGIGKDGRLDLSRICETIAGSGADIVALQEVERYSVRTGFQDQIAYLADKLSMHYVYGKSLNILNGQYGNAILSKYPIESSGLERLPSKKESRTLLRADLKINGGSLAVYTTHLGLDKEERREQFERIAELARDTAGPHVVTGDFNCTSDALSSLDQYMDSGASLQFRDQNTFESDGLGSRIDYILLSDGLETMDYTVLQSGASDHYPVLSTIELK